MLQLSFVVKQKGVGMAVVSLLVFFGSCFGLETQAATAASLRNPESHTWQEGDNSKPDPTAVSENEAANSNGFSIPLPVLLVIALAAFLAGAILGLILLKTSQKDSDVPE